MQDLDSLLRVVSDKERPVQFIFAAKPTRRTTAANS